MKVLLPLCLLVLIQFIPIFAFQERQPLNQVTALSNSIENTSNEAASYIFASPSYKAPSGSLKRF